MRAYDQAVIRAQEDEAVRAAGVDHLMKKAAGAVAETCAQLVVERGDGTRRRVVALVGGGDNGGDALYAVAMLQKQGIDCDAIVLHPSVHPRALCAAEAAGVQVHRPALDRSARQVALAAARVVSGCAVIVDGIVGTGASGPLREPAASVVAVVAAGLAEAGSRLGRTRKQSSPDGHRAQSAPPARRPLVVAVDTPSGAGATDGTLAGEHLAADVTVTMGAVKPSALLPPAAHATGQLRLVDLGLSLPADAERVRSLEAGDVGCLWAVPGCGDHKYTRGVAHVLAGSTDYPLTGVMCVEAAARTGAGMVRYTGPADAALAVLTRIPEAVAAPGRYQASLVGPGLSPLDDQRLDEAAEAIRYACASRLPLVLDAGALGAWRHLMATLPQARPGNLTVLTPHAGEAARLLTELGCGSTRGGVSRAEVEAAPLAAAHRLTELTGAVVVLKGAATLIVAPGAIPYVQNQAPAWAGTAGSGDVLAGILVSTLAAAEAACEEAGTTLTVDALARHAAAAVWIHGTAARLAAGLSALPAGTGDTHALDMPAPEPVGAGAPIVATDIIAAIPDAVRAALAAGPLRYAG